MDLSFTRSDRASEPRTLPTDLAVLMVGVSARQAASITAGLQVDLARSASVTPTRFAPADGRFSTGAARALSDWKNA